MSSVRLRLLPVAAFVAVVFALAAPVAAQTLYCTVEIPSELRRISATTGATVSTIGTLTSIDGVAIGSCIAMDPTTGIMYTALYDGTVTIWIATVNLSTGAITEIAMMADFMRDMTFDSTGKLWGVVSDSGSNPNKLVSINKTTGARVVENGSLPTTSNNKIAYNFKNDRLYVLGDTAGAYQLYSFVPTAPTVLTNIPLTGATIDGDTPGPMVFDRFADVLRTQGVAGDDLAWVTISLSGVVTMTTPNLGVVYGGLAWDQASSMPVELSTFAVE